MNLALQVQFLEKIFSLIFTGMFVVASMRRCRCACASVGAHAHARTFCQVCGHSNRCALIYAGDKYNNVRHVLIYRLNMGDIWRIFHLVFLRADDKRKELNKIERVHQMSATISIPSAVIGGAGVRNAYAQDRKYDSCRRSLLYV